MSHQKYKHFQMPSEMRMMPRWEEVAEVHGMYVTAPSMRTTTHTLLLHLGRLRLTISTAFFGLTDGLVCITTRHKNANLLE